MLLKRILLLCGVLCNDVPNVGANQIPKIPSVPLWVPPGRPPVNMPLSGLGTAFGFTPPGSTNVTYNAVLLYLQNGGRALHTAWMYCNQQAVGQAIKDSGIPRSELFIMSMLPQWHMGYEETYASFNDSLAQLQLDHVDLYMFHWPGLFPQNMPMMDPPHIETCGIPVTKMPRCKQTSWSWKACRLESWRAMTELQAAGRIGALGVSNFNIQQMEELRATGNRAAVNQIEYHIGFHDDILREYASNESLVLQAYSPLGGGRLAKTSTNAAISAAALAHNKTAAQVALRFISQGGVAAIPKASTVQYMIENADVFDWELTPAEMIALGGEATPNTRAVTDSDSMMCIDKTKGRMARCSYLDVAYGFA